MTAYVALLRAVNVGGVALKMADLKAACEAAGFDHARTYIASGNAVFASPLGEAKVQAELERQLEAGIGKRIPVLIRTATDMKALVAANPFPEADPSRNYVLFLDKPPTDDVIEAARHVTVEELRLGKRAIYVHYPNGMGRSKLTIPAAKTGTARNMNTVAKLAEMAAELG